MTPIELIVTGSEFSRSLNVVLDYIREPVEPGSERERVLRFALQVIEREIAHASARLEHTAHVPGEVN
jgi:hypothetical protein